MKKICAFQASLRSKTQLEDFSRHWSRTTVPPSGVCNRTLAKVQPVDTFYRVLPPWSAHDLIENRLLAYCVNISST